jgi:Kef-type K+ transport system membrane component KefB
MSPSLATLLIIPAIAVAAPLLSTGLSRFVKIPVVVFEIVLGLVLGPAVLGWVAPDEFISVLADYGLAMLFFLAGSEIDFARVRGRPLNRSLLGWLLAVVVGIAAGTLLAQDLVTGVFIGVALTSTALGTIMPVLRDTGELRTPFGTAVIAVGAVGEFGPLIAISLFLSGRRPGTATVVLLVFVAVAAIAIAASVRGGPQRLHNMISTTLRTSGQFAVRFVILLVAALVALSLALSLDMLLGAFAAGVIVRLLLAGATAADREAVESKLEAVGFGFLVPIFFIDTGLRFDLGALTSSTAALVLLVVFTILLLLIRGSSGLLTAPSGASSADRRAIALLTATGLPVIVAVTDIGVESGELPVGTASGLVGAGMLSVLLFPLLALSQRRPSRAAGERDDRDEDLTDEAW